MGRFLPVRAARWRQEIRCTIRTANRPLEDWGNLIGDVPSATAILDRFLHHAEMITITGRSYLLKDHPATEPLARSRQRKQPSELKPAEQEACQDQSK